MVKAGKTVSQVKLEKPKEAQGSAWNANVRTKLNKPLHTKPNMSLVSERVRQ